MLEVSKQLIYRRYIKTIFYNLKDDKKINILYFCTDKLLRVICNLYLIHSENLKDYS